MTAEVVSTPQAKPKPRNEPVEIKAEPIPQLRKVATPKAPTNQGGNRPKSALLPSGQLKPMQSVVQNKTKEDDSDLFPRYDYVVSPTALTEFSLSVSQQQQQTEAQRSRQDVNSLVTLHPSIRFYSFSLFCSLSPFPAFFNQMVRLSPGL